MKERIRGTDRAFILDENKTDRPPLSINLVFERESIRFTKRYNK